MTSSLPGPRPRVVIVGGGFAGHSAARSLAKRIGDAAEIVLINPTDYFLYLPLLPEVAAGVLDPRRITVSLAGDAARRSGSCSARSTRSTWPSAGSAGPTPRAGAASCGYDRLVLAVGSVNKLLPIPGVAEHAHGFRGIPEALYLRDHVTRQIELAATTEDPREREARCTFVVVGAGYTGTEVAAQGPLFTDALVAPARDAARAAGALAAARPRRAGAARARPAAVAHRRPGAARARGRGAHRAVRGGGEPRRRPPDDGRGDPDSHARLVRRRAARPARRGASGCRRRRGGSSSTRTSRCPGHPDLFACGDAAAVPDLTRPGEVTAMTAQHAVRQGKLAARNVAASLGHGTPRRYRTTTWASSSSSVVATPPPTRCTCRCPGSPAKAVTRGYHLLSMPSNRARIAADWLLDAVLPRQTVQLGLVRGPNVPLETASPELERAAGASRGS